MFLGWRHWAPPGPHLFFCFLLKGIEFSKYRRKGGANISRGIADLSFDLHLYYRKAEPQNYVTVMWNCVTVKSRELMPEFHVPMLESLIEIREGGIQLSKEDVIRVDGVVDDISSNIFNVTLTNGRIVYRNKWHRAAKAAFFSAFLGNQISCTSQIRVFKCSHRDEYYDNKVLRCHLLYM